MAHFSSKYGEARHIYINIPKAGSANHAVSADWTPAAGDVKISKDGGAAANVTNLPTAIAMGNSAIWDLSLTATEMQAAQVNITIADSATKAVDDTGFVIETYGHASAQHAFDLDTAKQAVDVDTIKTQTITCAAGVTVLASVGTATTSTAQTGDCYTRLGAPAGASVSADVAAIYALADTEVAAILAAVDTEVAAIKAKTDNLPGSPAATGDAMTLTAGERTAIAAAAAVYQITESYRGTNAAPTLAQAICEILGHLGEMSISGTTKTIKKFDGITAAKTYTLDDATNPSSITETT